MKGCGYDDVMLYLCVCVCVFSAAAFGDANVSIVEEENLFSSQTNDKVCVCYNVT